MVKHIFFCDGNPFGDNPLRRTGRPAEKYLGRHLLRIDFNRFRSYPNLPFPVDEENSP
jgi:hypothetical protein